MLFNGKRSKQSRKTYTSTGKCILFETLKNNPDILGVYTLWEPNAFDGLDSQYANTDGNDATGRFIPYWVHGGDGNIQHDSCLLIMKRKVLEIIIFAPNTQKMNVF